MAKDINVVSICGSLRAGSLNRMLMNSLQDLVPVGMTITEAPGIGDIPLFNGDVLAADGVPASVTALADAVAALARIVAHVHRVDAHQRLHRERLGGGAKRALLLLVVALSGSLGVI